MLWAYNLYIFFLFIQCGDRLYTSESDVYRRQILTYKDGPRAERFKLQYYKRFLAMLDIPRVHVWP